MINISSVRFKRLTRAQVCIDGTAAPLLGRAERSNPRSPEGRAGRREGLTAKSARRATIVSGHCAANVTAFVLLIFFPSFDVPMTLFNSPKAEPFAMRRSPHQLISGRGEPRTKVPHATCEGTGLQGGWDPSATRLLSASHAHGHTSTLESVMFLSSSFSESHHSFRAAPSGTRPVSR